jgi:hypothetical protein
VSGIAQAGPAVERNEAAGRCLTPIPRMTSLDRRQAPPEGDPALRRRHRPGDARHLRHRIQIDQVGTSAVSDTASRRP